MASHFLLGYSKGHRSLHKKYGYCLVCNQISECEIIVQETTLKVFLKTIAAFPEAYIFAWAACDHCVGIFDKADVKRYQETQALTDLFDLPNRREMKIVPVNSPTRKWTAKHYLELAVIVIVGIILAILLIFVLKKLSLPIPIV